MLHGCLGIGKFSPSFENTVQHSGENVVSLHVHVISSMYDISYMHIILTNNFVYSCTCNYAPTSVYSVVSSCCWMDFPCTRYTDIH